MKAKKKYTSKIEKLVARFGTTFLAVTLSLNNYDQVLGLPIQKRYMISHSYAGDLADMDENAIFCSGVRNPMCQPLFYSAPKWPCK